MKNAIFVLCFYLMFMQLNAVYHKLGEYRDNYVNDVEVVGDLAYVAEASGLLILDVSEPQSPTLLGLYPSEYARAVAVDGNLVYVIDMFYGLLVIDVSDPQNPSLLGSYAGIGWCKSIDIAQNKVYVGDADNGLLIIDVCDPHNPTLLGSCALVNATRSLAVEGNIAFVCTYGGLQIISVSNPQNPVQLGFYPTPSDAWSVAVEGNTAFVCAYENGLLAIDVSSPQNPVLLGTYVTPGNPVAVAVGRPGNTAYVAVSSTLGSNSLQVIDVSNPHIPNLLGTYSTYHSYDFVEVSGNKAYLGEELTGLVIIDLTDQHNTNMQGSCATSSRAYEVAVSGNIACVANDEDGMQIIDISDPQNPELESSHSCPGSTYAVELIGNTAYLAGDFGLQIIDISDPQDPLLLSWFHTEGTAWTVAVAGGLACLASTVIDIPEQQSHTELRIIDVSNPMIPTQLGNFGTPGLVHSLAIAGNKLYVADFVTGLLIYDISQPQNPIHLGTHPGTTRSVAVSGNVAYVSYPHPFNGLKVIDISDSQNPILLHTILPHPTSTIWKCLVNSDRLYISDTAWNEILAYDISDPQSPVLNGNYGWNLGSYDMCIEGNFLFTASYGFGTSIHNLPVVGNNDLTVVAPPALTISCFPNPLLNTSKVAGVFIEFTLPRKPASHPQIEIFNIRGQKVKTVRFTESYTSLVSKAGLSNDVKQDGEFYSTVWNGKDDNNRPLASGTYIVKVTADRRAITTKITIIK